MAVVDNGVEGDAVRQHVGLRRSRPGQARSRDRPPRHRQQGDGAAHPARDPGERTAEGHGPDGDRQRLRPARRQGRFPHRTDRPRADRLDALRLGRASRTASSRSPTRRRAPSSAGTGRTVTRGGLLQRALALAATADGHILATNGKNGQVVEFDPASGKQLAAQWIDSNQAQSPPGNGDLFGLAMAPDGRRFLLRRGRREHAREGDAMTKRDRTPPQATRRGFLSATAGLAAFAGSNLRAGRGSGAGRRNGQSERAFLGRASGRRRHPGAGSHLYRRLRPGDRQARRRREAAAPMDRRRRGAERGPAGRDSRRGRLRGAGRPFRRAGPVALAAHPDLRLRPGAVREGRGRPLWPSRAAAGGVRRSAAFPRRPIGPSANGRRSARCRPAPTIRRSPSTPFVNWRASPTASPISAGFRPDSSSDFGAGRTPRNLMGFKDGTGNPADRATPRKWTPSSGRARKRRRGCAAAATSSSAARGSRSNIGIA